MTLEEAIKHCYQRAEENKTECPECAEDHHQLAEWLTELKERREKEPKQGEWFPVAELDTTNDFAEWIDVNGDGSIMKCSKCGEKVCCKGNNFCPNCGSDMRNKTDLK